MNEADTVREEYERRLKNKDDLHHRDCNQAFWTGVVVGAVAVVGLLFAI